MLCTPLQKSDRSSAKNLRRYTETFLWGCDRYGQLGMANVAEKETEVVPRVCSFQIVILKISCGYDHTLFLAEQGYVYAMGKNSEGQLGQGPSNRNFSKSPSLVEGIVRHRIQNVSSGHNHCAVLSDQGEIFVWGRGFEGQLGIGEKRNLFEPLMVSAILRVRQVFSGGNSTFLLDHHNDVWCSGDGSQGQLGTQEQHFVYSFRRTLLSLPTIKAISIGCSHSLFLDFNGELWGVGSNTRNQLGMPQQSVFLKPAKIGEFQGTRISKIFSGKKDLSAAISEAGDLYLWGGSEFYENIKAPFKIKALQSGAEEVAIGSNFCCILDREQNVYSLGDNTSGQLGISHVRETRKPVMIGFLKDKKIRNLFAGHDFTFALGRESCLFEVFSSRKIISPTSSDYTVKTPTPQTQSAFLDFPFGKVDGSEKPGISKRPKDTPTNSLHKRIHSAGQEEVMQRK